MFGNIRCGFQRNVLVCIGFHLYMLKKPQIDYVLNWVEDSSTGTTTSSSVLFFIKKGACVCFIGRNLRIDGTRWNNRKSTCEI